MVEDVPLSIRVGSPIDWRRTHLPHSSQHHRPLADTAVLTLCGRQGRWATGRPRRPLGVCLACTSLSGRNVEAGS